MALDPFNPLLLTLAFLAFVLVTCALKVLANHHHHAVEIYDRVRQSKAMRQRYIDSLRERANQ